VSRPRPIPIFGKGRDRFRPVVAVNARRVLRIRRQLAVRSPDYFRLWLYPQQDNPTPVKPGIDPRRAHYGRRRKRT
jgi:hypothetical protein